MPTPRPRREWIDVTVPLSPATPHWPDVPNVGMKRLADMDRGAVCNVTWLELSVHTGTHMDAPLHFINGAIGMDQMPLDATIGPARVVEVKDVESIQPRHLEVIQPRRGERLIFKTSNTTRCWDGQKFVKDFTYIAQDAAAELARLGVRTVGVDYLSVGGFFQDGVETHHHLLKAGIWIIEGLDLRQVGPGRYDLLCLPLKTLNCDGAPCRALLRPK